MGRITPIGFRRSHSHKTKKRLAEKAKRLAALRAAHPNRTRK